MYYGNVSTVSNREDWQEAFILVDADTGDLIDISLCRITLTLVQRPRQADHGDLYYGYGDIYGPGSGCAVALQGSTDTGEITLPELGTFMWLFPEESMKVLRQGEYQIGVRISQDDRTVQLIVGTVDVVEGIDTQ